MGDALVSAATRAGTTGQAFSELAYAAKQSGVGTTELSAAMVKMNEAMSKAGTGAKEPNDALAALGLTFNQLKNLKPDEQLEAIADRTSKLQSPADRSRALLELFGRAGAELGPLFEQGAAGIEKMRNEAERVGASFSDEMLGKLEEAHKSIDRMTTSWSSFATTVTGAVAPSLSGMMDNVSALVADDRLGKLHAEIDFLQRYSGQSIFSFGKAQGFEDISAGFYGPDAIAKKLGELQDRFDQLSLANTSDRLARQSAGMTNLLGDMKPPGFLSDPADLQPFLVGVSKMRDPMEEFYNRINELTQTDVERTVEAYEKKKAALDELYNHGIITADQYNARLAEATDEALPGVTVTAERTEKQIEEVQTAMAKLAEQGAQSMQSAFANFLFDPLHGGFRRMAVDFLDTLRRMAADAAASKIFNAVFDPSKGGLGGMFDKLLSFGSGSPGGGGDGSGIGSAIGGLFGKLLGAFTGGNGVSTLSDADYASIFAVGTQGASGAATSALSDVDYASIFGLSGAMAEGGLVSAGSSYLVGEEGPELFTPSSHGIVTPNSDLGSALGGGGGWSGDMHFHTNIDARGADADRIMTLLPPILARHSAQTKADMLNAFRRSGLAAPVKA